ncbi:hypothetical protein VNI00_010019 [Paramarasmius palmivorus]|uniref:TauD/TfdA-like domain-containing protein n=1 Tax=Paramarasmius palmivorus TaxID=297713 RepID=A0AAW0CMQ7_9AGAR
MVHPLCLMEVIIEPISREDREENTLYPNGAHLTDLREIRELVHKMERPGITPSLVYPHDWHEKDLMLFHNRGVMHSVVGVFKDGQIRVFHQCNIAGSDIPQGPSNEDRLKWE